MNVLILVGSPKGRSSTSFLLGSKLADGLRNCGAVVTDGMVHRELQSEAGTTRLLDGVDAADLVVLAFPLYIDSLPAPLIHLLEIIAERRSRAASPGTPRLVALVQCGFPESRQCDTAVAICRLFALRTGMVWAGALAMGMGGQLAGGIEKLPGGGKHTLDALRLAAESLANGGNIPFEAATSFGKPLIPRWIYTMFGNLGWRMQMRKNEVRRPIGFRPFDQA